jgi:hypothetical protein
MTLQTNAEYIKGLQDGQLISVARMSAGRKTKWNRALYGELQRRRLVRKAFPKQLCNLENSKG